MLNIVRVDIKPNGKSFSAIRKKYSKSTTNIQKNRAQKPTKERIQDETSINIAKNTFTLKIAIIGKIVRIGQDFKGGKSEIREAMEALKNEFE